MFTGTKDMYIGIMAALAISLIAAAIPSGPIYADTDVDVVGGAPAGLTLTKLTETLFSLTGKVGLADCARIVPLLPDHPFTLILESLGGSMGAGICLAKDLKERDVITVIRDTQVLDEDGAVLYQPDYDGDGYVVCASACSVLFLAGDVRYLMGDVYFGLHGPGIPENASMRPTDAFTYGVQAAEQVILILKHLGVSEDVRLLVLRIPSSQMLYVRPEHFEQMEGLRYIANHYVDFWGYTGTNPHDRLRG